MNVNIKKFQALAAELLSSPHSLAKPITTDLRAISLNQAIETISQEWANLDAVYASQKVKKKLGKSSGSQLLTLPQGVDFTDVDHVDIETWHHPRIPDTIELSSLFQRFALDVRKLTQPSQLRTQHLMANVKDTHPIRGFMRKPNYKPATTTSSVAVPSERVASTDTIMTVSISPPAMPLAPSQTLRILGTQTLLDLRDAIYCLYDHVSYSSDGVDSKCCLVIDDTVFVDTRAADIVEYKALINRWKSRESNTRISTANASPLPSNALLRSLLSVSPEDTSDVSASFHVVPMHSTMINSLTITLGKCYTLLHHHLSCAHHVYFTDITLYNSKYDSKYRSSYPLLVHQAKLHRRKCGVCGVLAADFCTFGDRLVDKSPYFFCHGCYQMLHYDCEGNLLYKDFAVFPYYHDTK